MMQQAWHQLGPLQIRDWVRANLLTLGIERVAAELEKLSEQFASVGLADPTTSILVTTEMSKYWQLKPPGGWDAEHVEMWKRLPYAVAKYITERRELDRKAVSRCMHLNAELKRNGHAAHTPA
ncbi:MAG: hypothetical protein JO254_04735 [Pseudolabrys sp.]|nr:hypothetical protein [Pseudolabrys sp.]